MPEQITTVAQLSGYPLGAVFTDIEGGVWMIDSRNPATGACWMLSPETVRMSAKHVLRKWGPLTPVWRPDQAVGSPKVASKSDAKTDDGHTCDAGHFDRTICPEPCNSMHFYCSGCGARQDVCTHDLSVVPGQDLEIPTAEAVAEALLQYETGGMCHFGQTCGLCDCGRADETREQTQTRDAMELDRARAALALFPEQRCAPSEDEIAGALVLASKVTAAAAIALAEATRAAGSPAGAESHNPTLETGVAQRGTGGPEGGTPDLVAALRESIERARARRLQREAARRAEWRRMVAEYGTITEPKEGQ